MHSTVIYEWECLIMINWRQSRRMENDLFTAREWVEVSQWWWLFGMRFKNEEKMKKKWIEQENKASRRDEIIGWSDFTLCLDTHIETYLYGTRRDRKIILLAFFVNWIFIVLDFSLLKGRVNTIYIFLFNFFQLQDTLLVCLIN